MEKLIDGKMIARNMRQAAAEKVAALKSAGKTVGFAVILVGDDPASKVYVNNKKKACIEVGIDYYEYILPEKTKQEELIALIDRLNTDKRVSGFLCQMPLPRHLDEKAVIERIDPGKDVDAFSPVNVGRIVSGDYAFLPCTPAGVMELLRYENISVSGKNCVVIGRSNIVGKPMALMLLKEDATVTVCHSKTVNLSEITRGADILISAVGRAGFVTADMVKEGAVVIDVGMNRGEDGKLCGDVDFKAVAEKASRITPVPGCVGPMTIAMLIENVVTAAQKK